MENKNVFKKYSSVLYKLLVFVLVWIGIYHIYTNQLDTGVEYYKDLIGSFLATLLVFYKRIYNKSK
jgi:hypothetical protein